MHSPYGRCDLAAKVSVTSGSPETAFLEEATSLFDMREGTSRSYTSKPWPPMRQVTPGDTKRGRSVRAQTRHGVTLEARHPSPLFLYTHSLTKFSDRHSVTTIDQGRLRGSHKEQS